MKRDIGPETTLFIMALNEHCKAERGRAANLARHLGIHQKRLCEWWHGNEFPTTEQVFQIKKWLQSFNEKKSTAHH